jgi:hypothetical protein
LAKIKNILFQKWKKGRGENLIFFEGARPSSEETPS